MGTQKIEVTLCVNDDGDVMVIPDCDDATVSKFFARFEQKYEFVTAGENALAEFWESNVHEATK